MISKAYVVSIVTLLVIQNCILAAPLVYYDSRNSKKIAKDSNILDSFNNPTRSFLQGKGNRINSNPTTSSNGYLSSGASKPSFEVNDVLRQPFKNTSSGLSYKRPSKNFKGNGTSKPVGSGSLGEFGKSQSSKIPDTAYKGAINNNFFESPENEIVIDTFKEPLAYKRNEPVTKNNRGKKTGKFSASKRRKEKNNKIYDTKYSKSSNKKEGISKALNIKNNRENGNKDTSERKTSKIVSSKKRKTDPIVRTPPVSSVLSYKRPNLANSRPTNRSGLIDTRPSNYNFHKPRKHQPLNGNSDGGLSYARPGQTSDLIASISKPGQGENSHYPSQTNEGSYAY